MKALKIWVFSFLVLMFLVVSGCAGQTKENVDSKTIASPGKASTDPIVLNVLTAWEENNIQSVGFTLFKEKIEEKSEGKIKVKYLGGPEAVPAFNQGDAIRNGTADISFISTAYFASLFPESTVLAYTQLTPQEERDTGALDYLNEFAKERMNAIILGHAIDMKYSLYLKDPIQSIEEFKGKRIRAAPVYIPFIEALGAEVISMPAGEMYTALERGVIDGLAWPEAGITDFGLEKLVSVKVAPPYNSVDTVTIMNLNKYNSLPEDAKNLLVEVMTEVENEVGAIIEEYLKGEEQKFAENGLKTVTISDEQKYLDMAVNASWDWVKENLKDGEQFEKLFRD